eukprot:Seg6529.2 transcript_id=Seg6529.2/GoldUCD/mRNA.D3Y31 product="hypothetical protein" protein_id=Seg6529.2/GoldUCD/D3Y31
MLQILQSQYQFEREFDHMVSRLVAILSSYRHKTQRLTTEGQRRFEWKKEYTGTSGRPAYRISYDQVDGLVSLGFTWKRIAELLCVSERTLRRWRQDFVFDVPFSEMEDEVLDDIVAAQLQSCPSMGERLLAGALRSEGLRIQRQRLRESIMRVDPLGRIWRRFQVMRRRVYKVEGPNALWYVGNKFSFQFLIPSPSH